MYGQRAVRLADGPVRWNDWESLRTGPPTERQGDEVQLINRSEFPLPTYCRFATFDNVLYLAAKERG
jgi:hypothetical protein